MKDECRLVEFVILVILFVGCYLLVVTPTESASLDMENNIGLVGGISDVFTL